MSWLIWNICGVRRRETIDHLKAMIRQKTSTFVVLLEPMVDHSEVANLAFKIGFTNWMHGGDVNSHMWILWKPDWSVEQLYITDQAFTVRVRINATQSCIASFVYASCLKRIRQNLWEHLAGVQQIANISAIPWLVAGILILSEMFLRNKEGFESI